MTECTNTISTFELLEKFPTKESARLYFEKQLWNNKPKCPSSANQTPKQVYHHPSPIGLYRCKCCKTQFSVCNNVVMHASKISLRKWLYGMYLVVTASKGIASYQLAKELSITQKSAWFMGHRIPKACKNNDVVLARIIEIDETYVDGKEKTKKVQGRSTKTKTPVVSMRDRSVELVATKMGNVNGANIQSMIDNHVDDNARLCTDEATIYKRIKGYKQLMVNHSAGQYVNGIVHTDGIESVWALLKRGYNGVFHHFSDKHIRHYADEFVFRLNDGNVKRSTLDRMDSIMSRFSGNTIFKK